MDSTCSGEFFLTDTVTVVRMCYNEAKHQSTK